MNKHRTFELFTDFYFALLDRLEPSVQRCRWYAIRLQRKIVLLDASIIPLSLSLFNETKFRTKKE